MTDSLRLVLRTPHGIAYERDVRSARVASPTGFVGIRPRNEAFACEVDPGLVVIDAVEGRTFAATCGGLVETDGRVATLLSPIIVVGSEHEVLEELGRVLESPTNELAARRTLARLEQRLLHELRSPKPAKRATERSHDDSGR